VAHGGAVYQAAYKREMYAEVGIPCYWRVEIDPWRGHDDPYPLIVARLRDGDGWRTVEAPAGEVTSLPLGVGRGVDGELAVVEVKLDPSVLLP